MLGHTTLRMLYERYGKFIRNRTRQDGARFTSAWHHAARSRAVLGLILEVV
jgi:hypothetical protein